jgi:FkbM family methyltransferase
MSFHSQDNQDKFLHENVFKGYKNGVFMDIGAHDGVSINNTLYFEKEHGWTGVNIEPINDVYQRLVSNRPECINLNCAVSDTIGTAEFILNRGYTEMLSGLKNSYDLRHVQRMAWEIRQYGGSTETISVNTDTVENICKTHSIDRINYLSIDVEGGEFAVIKSIDFDKVFIDVIGFENNYPDNSQQIIAYLESKNYRIIPCNGWLDIFMIHRDSHFNAV